MKKRFLSSIVSLCMLLTMLPTVAVAVGEDEEVTTAVTSGDCGAEGSDVKWEFDTDTGTLTISGTGAMDDYTFTNNNGDMHTTAPWKDFDADIQHVVVKSGVTKIGSHAFFLCENLESVKLPEGITTIEDRAFWQTSLKDITIPASVTQIGSTIKEVFYMCYDLENITVASGNTAYKSVDGVLYTADGTTLIQYPQNKADTSYKMIDEATTIDFLAFNYTQNLETIDFNNVTTVADKGVYGNQALKEIDLKNVTHIGFQGFTGNKAVKSLKMEKVPETLGTKAFNYCTSLENVTLPDEMQEFPDYMFEGCSSLKSIQFPAQLKKIGKGCFDGAGLAGDLVIPASVKNIGFIAFRNCYGLTSITVEGNPTFDNGDATYAFQFCNNLMWMKARFNITKYFGGLNTPDEYKDETLEPQNSSWFTAEGKEVNSSTSITEETTFYRWFTKKVPLNANGGKNNGNIQEVYAFFAPALEEDETIQFPDRYYRGQVSYVVAVDDTQFTRDGYTFKEWTGDAAAMKPYAISKYIYNYMPDAVYAQWNKIIDEDTYFVYPVIEDQTYTGSELKPAVRVTKNDKEITTDYTVYTVEYSNNTDVGTATATVKVNGTEIGTATFEIVKATPELAISATPDTLTGGGTVTLTVTGAPEKVVPTCEGVTITENENGTFSASLPNTTKEYKFTAAYAGDDNHNEATATCKVSVTRRSSSSSSSSSSSGSYAVSAPSTRNGDVTVSPKNASKGDTVTITVTPDKGYELDTITVKDASGNKLKLTDKGNGKYTFTMPGSKVTVSAEFVEAQTATFPDVPDDAYYADAVDWAVKNGITNGRADGLFGSNDPCTRGQIVTFLWRAAGSPAPKTAVNPFTDVAADAYYAKAVLWAVENGITNGTTETTFSPDMACTRAQCVAFLFRSAVANGLDAVTLQDLISGFGDAADLPGYAVPAMNWALSGGIVQGSSGLLNPNGTCTRAQIVTFLYRAR